MMKGWQSKRKAGFTLVELLVAMTVTTALLLLLARILFGATQLWRHSVKRAETWREARAAVHYIERDLNTAAPAEAFGSGALPGMLFARHPDAGEGSAHEELHFLTMQVHEGRRNLCAVGYRVVWDEGAQCYALKRRILPGEAVARGLGSGAESLYFSPEAEEEEMARYVWGVTFRPCADGIREAYPEGEVPPPSMVEVRFKAIGAQAVEQLQGSALGRDVWDDEEHPLFKRLILPYQQEFILRARLYVVGKEY